MARKIKQSLLARFSVVLILFAGLSLNRAEAEVAIPELPLVGSGTLKWYGLRIYDVEYREAADGCTPRILRITYARRIPAHRLIKATREQWQEIGLNNEPRQRLWLREVGTLWPDIKPGDFLQLMVDEKNKSHFYGVEGYLGSIDDPEFGNAFIAIWLSSSTSEPELRAQLLEGGSSCPVTSF